MTGRPNKTQIRKARFEQALSSLPMETQARLLATAGSGLPLVYHISDGDVLCSLFMDLTEDIELDYIWPADVLAYKQKGAD